MKTRGILARLEEIQKNMPSVTSEEAYARMEEGRRASQRARLLDFRGPPAAPSRIRMTEEEPSRLSLAELRRIRAEMAEIPVTSAEAYKQMEAARLASERASRLDLMRPPSAPSRLRDFAEEK